MSIQVGRQLSPRLLLNSCPLCGASRTRPIFECDKFGVDWELHVCDDCGLHMTVPCPNDSQLAEMYSGDYHRELRIPGATERIFGQKFRRYANWIQRFCPPGRALDIGCSTGLLVRMLRDRGFDAEGLEMNSSSAAWGAEQYGVKVKNATLRDGLFEESSFQLVVMADVLEHTVTPLMYLGMVRRILRPGGYMFVSFPDVASLESRYWLCLSRMTGKAWLWRNSHIPGHIWEFTRSVAERMFRQAGFEVIAFRRSQPEPEVDLSLVGLLALPTQLLRMPGINRLCGTQMEFLIRLVD